MSAPVLKTVLHGSVEFFLLKALLDVLQCAPHAAKRQKAHGNRRRVGAGGYGRQWRHRGHVEDQDTCRSRCRT